MGEEIGSGMIAFAQPIPDSTSPADDWPKCPPHIAAALWKATLDGNYRYALGLNSGLVLVFEGATITGNWAHLNGLDKDFLPLPATDFESGRGIDIRLADIVWVADYGH